MVNLDLANAVWRKSSFTQASGECVEIAFPEPTVAGIRDSKDPDGGMLVTSFQAWDAFRRFSKLGGVAGA